MKTDALTKASSFDFLDTNVMSETFKRAPDSSVIAWLVRHDAELALPTVAVAEIAFGIQKIRPDQRADRLEEGLVCWRRRFSDRMFAFTEEAALAYGDIMGDAARQGRGMSAPDGMIAAIARINGGRLAARNLKDFETTGLELISPWQF
jgi:predicted nucleic acid-binding protein